MDLTLALICDDARERPDGRLDIVGAYNELAAPGFPALQSRMTVVFVMEWTEEETGPQAFRADLVEESGTRVLTIEGETHVAPRSAGRAPRRTRLILPLEQVVFPQAGRYRFEVLAGGDLYPACSIFVTEAEASPPNGSQHP
jgi:hypothetical protein